MSALEVVEGAASALTGGLWKLAAAAALLLAAGAGGGWWLAAHDRDLARQQLKAEQAKSAGLAGAIETQNIMVGGLAAAKADADTRRLAAEQAAAVAGKRYSAASAALAGARATTCDEAMPAVDRLLESLR